VILIVAGCVPATYHKYDVSMVKPVEAPKPVYMDENITAMFFLQDSQIAFDITNKTENSIRINWDEASYVSPTGQSQRVIHSGIRLMDRNAPQAPTLIAPNAKISDIIIPSENIYYVSGQYGGWRENDLLPGDDKTIYKGLEFGILLPLEIKCSKKEYNFRFKVDNVSKVEIPY
jgi:hypothetical protein